MDVLAVGLRRHPELLPQYEKTLKLLELDPFHPSLRLHRLLGPLRELCSDKLSQYLGINGTLAKISEPRLRIPGCCLALGK